jgi:hypothetical protein
MPVSALDKIYLAMISDKVNLKMNYFKVPKGAKRLGHRDFVMRHFFPVAEAIINVFLSDGVEGAEIANHYSTAPFPVTEKKIQAALSKLKKNFFFIFFFS